MNWLNIETHILHSPEFIGSAPEERATWLCIIGYCVEQENSGRIVGGCLWKDRQWQQTCGVTTREVRSTSRLVTIEGEDVVVFGYPLEKQLEVQAKRKQAAEAARSRWERINGNSQNDTPSDASRIAPAYAPRNPEWNGMEGKGKEEGAHELTNHRQATRTLPESLDTPPFRKAWGDWLEYTTEKNGKVLPTQTLDKHLIKLASMGPVLAVQAIDNGIARNLREPELPNGKSTDEPRVPKYTPLN